MTAPAKPARFAPPDKLVAYMCPACCLVGGIATHGMRPRGISTDCPACEDHPKLVRVRYQLAARRGQR